jgi:MFS family permease
MARIRFYGWILVAALWIIYFIESGIIMYGGSVINTHMVLELGMSRKVLGFGFTVFILCQGMISLIVGPVVNRKGIRFTLCAGGLITLAGSVLMALLPGSTWAFFLMFGVVIGIGTGFGGLIPVQTGIVTWFARKRAIAMSIVMTAAGIGGFIAAPGLNMVIKALEGNWRAGWYVVALLAGLSVLVSILLVKNKPSDLGQQPDGAEGEGPAQGGAAAAASRRVYQTTQAWTRSEVFRTRAIWLIAVTILCFIFPFMFSVSHGMAHFIDLGHSEAAASMSLGLITLFSIAGRLIGGGLGDRYESRCVWFAAIILLILGQVSAMFGQEAWLLYAYAVFTGLGFGIAYICQPTMISNYFGSQVFASVMAFLIPLLTVFSASASYIGGWIHDASGSYMHAFSLDIILLVIGAVAVLGARPPAGATEPARSAG